ncbi:hypothetical protein Tco_1533768, partial [Tanacetum coccineum]
SNVALNSDQNDRFTEVKHKASNPKRFDRVQCDTGGYCSSLFNVEEDIEGEMEHVYDVNGTFMASGSRYGTKSLYER